jgi:hypothetical protein
MKYSPARPSMRVRCTACTFALHSLYICIAQLVHLHCTAYTLHCTACAFSLHSLYITLRSLYICIAQLVHCAVCTFALHSLYVAQLVHLHRMHTYISTYIHHTPQAALHKQLYTPVEPFAPRACACSARFVRCRRQHC